jgi:DNA-directed RNA polymerase specialized sigma24 family protein
MNAIERTSLRPPRLDRARASSTVRPVSAADRLQGQDWEKLGEPLTAFAYRRTGKRSWALAQDLAQSAIADLITHPESWDPEKEPLLKHLAKRVIGLASNEWSRKGRALEVLFAPGDAEDLPETEHAQDAIEDVLDRRRAAARFRARLDALVAGDEDAAVVVTQMAEGRDTPLAIAKASGLSIARVRDARRRIFYHARVLAKQMGDEIDAADDAHFERVESSERAGERSGEEEEVGG